MVGDQCSVDKVTHKHWSGTNEVWTSPPTTSTAKLARWSQEQVTMPSGSNWSESTIVVQPAEVQFPLPSWEAIATGPHVKWSNLSSLLLYMPYPDCSLSMIRSEFLWSGKSIVIMCWRTEWYFHPTYCIGKLECDCYISFKDGQQRCICNSSQNHWCSNYGVIPRAFSLREEDRGLVEDKVNTDLRAVDWLKCWLMECNSGVNVGTGNLSLLHTPRILYPIWWNASC